MGSSESQIPDPKEGIFCIDFDIFLMRILILDRNAVFTSNQFDVKI
jgi:hypothetical protein